MLAAAAVIFTAAAVVGVANAATVAQQEDEDDDPAHVTTTETIVIHNEYLQNLLATFIAHSKVFRNRKIVTALQTEIGNGQLIPVHRFLVSCAGNDGDGGNSASFSLDPLRYRSFPAFRVFPAFRKGNERTS